MFRIQVVSNTDVRSPIITLGSTSFFHVRINNLYVVAVTKCVLFLSCSAVQRLTPERLLLRAGAMRTPPSYSSSVTALSPLQSRTLARWTRKR